MHIINFIRCRFILTTLAATPSILFAYSPLLIGLTLIGVATPFATGRLIDSLAYHQPFTRPFAILSALLVVKALLSPLLDRFICSRARRIETDLQFRVLDATMNLSPGELSAIPDGEIVAKMTRDTYAVGGFIRNLYPRTLQAVVMMFATGFALHSRSDALGIAFLVFFPLAVILFSPFARHFSDNAHRVRRQGDTSFNTLFDFLQTLPFLKTLDAERRFADAPQTALTELRNSNAATDVLSIRFGFLLGLLLVCGEIAVLGCAGSLAAKGRIPVGDVVLYQMLFISAIQSVQGIIALLPDLSAIREAADSLHETLGHKQPEDRHEQLAPLTTLAFDHVTFAYPQPSLGQRTSSTVENSPSKLIGDFSATLHVGSVVGLSGVNGVGKSTLLKLAVGALEPQKGKILFNGHPLSEINLSLFRRRIGIVFQDNLLVTGTIRDNITLRDSSFTEGDIENALALSGFDTVVRRLPDGLDTPVGNRLRTLSGGERQRLAIARAIIRDPMILILDEATNHLDAESRQNVASLISKLRHGRLILLAGHDSELDKLCDQKICCQIAKNGSYITV